MNPSIGIVTLNAKFIHSSLSLRYLRNAARRAGFENVWILEFIINQPVWKITAEILKQAPDVLGLSVYIWNRKQSFELLETLQKQSPDLKIVLGGPEVSFEPELPSDYTLIAGEGENKWVEYLNFAAKGESPPRETLEQWNTYGNDLPELYPPYIEEDYPTLKNRYAYIEASRGCPYLCSFCLSALDKKVRYFDDANLRQQIKHLIQNGTRKIKFVDRTFNLKPERMRNLMQWLTQFDGTEFHFEVVGDLLNDEMMRFLETVPQGMFQFEIGVQTTTEEVQSTIHRKQSNIKLFNTIEALIQQDRVHIHCDLIFGLPGETLDELLESFTEVLKLKPHELQLGFLKFLPGAPIRDQIESHEYRYLSFPPYELLSHKNLSAEEVRFLKQFTEVFDLFYNSKRFQFSLDHLFRQHPPVELFKKLMTALEQENRVLNALSLDHQYRIFAETFTLDADPLAWDLLQLDYLYHQRSYRLPEFMRARLASNGSSRHKTWDGDRKTMVVPFHHTLDWQGPTPKLTPSPSPVYYAVAHGEAASGYMARPRIERVEP
ncbi:MAG: radical SAM protein [Nitrospinae bacterium]|nr:radical SAM protein [Nitrospinota bacterium]